MGKNFSFKIAKEVLTPNLCFRISKSSVSNKSDSFAFSLCSLRLASRILTLLLLANLLDSKSPDLSNSSEMNAVTIHITDSKFQMQLSLLC